MLCIENFLYLKINFLYFRAALVRIILKDKCGRVTIDKRESAKVRSLSEILPRHRILMKLISSYTMY